MDDDQNIAAAGEIRELTGFLKAADSGGLVVFTGAGISAESGIPTYRGVGGMWSRYDPEKYASIDYFRRDPSYYWRFFKEVRMEMMTSAAPSPAHLAVAELEAAGMVAAVITQNIDGLHQKAGSRRVLELHGNTLRFYCFDCRDPYTMEDIKRQLETLEIPVCGKCRGVLRPDVVLFGEMLPDDVVQEAQIAAGNCQALLVIGSSLVVYPAAHLPYQAKLAGARLGIINMDPTPLDSLADLRCFCPAGATLPPAVKALAAGV